MAWALYAYETPDGKKLYPTYGPGEKPKDAELAQRLKAMAPFQLLTMMIRARSSAMTELTPFNLLSYFTDSGINYTVEDRETEAGVESFLVFMKNTHKYRLAKVPGTNYFNPHSCEYDGTMVDGEMVVDLTAPKFNYGRTLVAPAPTLVRHIYLIISNCELKNKVFRNAVTAENEAKMFDIIPGYGPSTSIRMAALMNEYFRERTETLGNGQTTLRGDVLGHYLFVILDKEPMEVKIGFISTVSDLLQSIKPNVEEDSDDEEEEESIAIEFPPEKVQLMTNAGYPSDVTWKYVAYPARMQVPLTVSGLDLKSVEEGDEKLIYAARKHMESSRSIRGADDKKIGWLSQGCYWRLNMTDHFYKATKLRTDFSFLLPMLRRLKDTVKMVAIRGGTIQLMADMVRYLSAVPHLLFAVQSEDSNALDWFIDIARRVEVGVTVERAIAKFSQVQDPTLYMQSSVLVIDLFTINLKPYTVNSESSLKAVSEENIKEVMGYIKSVESYAYSVGYIPLITYYSPRRTILLESCTPHTCLAVFLKRGGRLGVYDFEAGEGTHEVNITQELLRIGYESQWQRILATYVDNDLLYSYRRYLFYSIYANFAKNVFHLTDITPGDIIKEKVNPNYVDPSWSYSKMQCVDKFKLGKNHVTYEEVTVRIKAYATLSLEERADVRRIITTNPIALAQVPEDVQRMITEPEEENAGPVGDAAPLAPEGPPIVQAGPTRIKKKAAACEL